ncbi:acyltransferase [Bradyrhizobium arachidis]|uniref:acyltransferase family protein n=1 Tax=Bradyrhizobium TaxID=374 RepID=UPI0021626842|nr:MULTISPECIES: acyltransferase [Bradyrhizobium]MDN4988171.1 acyltransferase [Bradyrhizobium sp. WYCCWR 13022]UVO35425.1 acyltransferase [Bradyrhizobium arachidis]
MTSQLPQKEAPVPRQGQLLQLNWIRAVAALLVVAYHCEVTMILPKYFGVSTFPLFKAGHSGVQLFFVLSGFVIYLAHHRDSEGNGSMVARFLMKRFRRIYPSLWIVLVPLIVLSFLGFATRVPDSADVVLSLLILPVKEEVILATEWTLRHEILFYALFACFLWNRKIGFWLLVTWGFIGLPLALFGDKGWLIDFIFNNNHVLFLCGVGIAWLYIRGHSAGGPYFLLAGLIVFAVTFYFAMSKQIPPNGELLLFGLGAAGIIHGACSMPSLNRKIAPLEEAGAASYALYLIHYPLISLLAKIAVKLNATIAAPRALYFVTIIAICQMAAIVFHRLIEAPLMKAAWMQRLFLSTGTTTIASGLQGASRDIADRNVPAPSSD